MLPNLILTMVLAQAPVIIVEKKDPPKQCKLDKKARDECAQAGRIPVCNDGTLAGTYRCDKPEDRPEGRHGKR